MYVHTICSDKLPNIFSSPEINGWLFSRKSIKNRNKWQKLSSSSFQFRFQYKKKIQIQLFFFFLKKLVFVEKIITITWGFPQYYEIPLKPGQRLAVPPSPSYNMINWHKRVGRCKALIECHCDPKLYFSLWKQNGVHNETTKKTTILQKGKYFFKKN